MKTLGCLFISLLSFVHSLNAQRKWPIPILLPEYGAYISLTNDVNLNDTTKILFNENTYFMIVLFDSKGKSYCEVFRNNKMYEKGYYENSLDTLKKYSSPVSINKRNGIIRVLQYFQPLKNGEWIETKKGRLVRKKYNMGIEEIP